MMDYFTSPIFLGSIIGFILMFMYQTIVKGPKEAERQERINKYMERLSPDALDQIQQTLDMKDKVGAMKIFQEDTQTGLVEAKECIDFIVKRRRKNS